MLSQTVMRKVLRRLQLRHTLVQNGAEAVEAFKRGACRVCRVLLPLLVIRQEAFVQARCVLADSVCTCQRAAEDFSLVLMDLHMPVRP